MPVNPTATSSTQLGAGYAANYAVDDILGGGYGWLSANPASFDEWLKLDFGSAKTFDMCFIAGQAYETGSIRNGKVQYSTDDAAWSDAASFTDLFGAALNSKWKLATITFAAQTARYWRILVQSDWGGGIYCGIQEVYFCSSASMGVRLDNAGGTVFDMFDAPVESPSVMCNRQFDAYGMQMAASAGVGVITKFTVDFGSSVYLGGFDYITFSDANYKQDIIDVWTSTDGLVWTHCESVVLDAWVANKLYRVPFSRIYQSRYFMFCPRLLAFAGVIWMEWFFYATLTPAAPPDPTSVTARASATGTDIELTWSEIAGDDNLLADLVYDITRQKDGGGYGSIATGVTGLYYVDTSLAAGDYDYKVQARNLYHARTSTAVQTGASVTSPSAAAGGGAGRTGAVSSQLVGASRQP